MNQFQNLLTPEFKQIFNDAIDTLLDPSGGLVSPCLIRYGGTPSSQTICNNCIFDTISQVSSNIYNSSGPQPFIDGSICPVCLGAGLINGGIATKEEVINLAVIVDMKSFINVADTVNIGNNAIQTISSIVLLPKLQNAIEIVVDGSAYQKATQPQICGLSDHKYVIMVWRQK
jgi:hypothetical protein